MTEWWLGWEGKKGEADRPVDVAVAHSLDHLHSPFLPPLWSEIAQPAVNEAVSVVATTRHPIRLSSATHRVHCLRARPRGSVYPVTTPGRRPEDNTRVTDGPQKST